MRQVAAGNSIFNVIVDTDVTAAKLMTLLEKRRQGRVTFMPLNRLDRRDYPRNPVSREVVHLIDVSGRSSCTFFFIVFLSFFYRFLLYTGVIFVFLLLLEKHG